MLIKVCVVGGGKAFIVQFFAYILKKKFAVRKSLGHLDATCMPEKREKLKDDRRIKAVWDTYECKCGCYSPFKNYRYLPLIKM